MKRFLALLLVVFLGIAWAVTDFAPHDLTSATSHSPMKVTAQHSYSGWVAYKIFDGAGNIEWIATPPVEWIKLDLDTGSGAEFTPHDLTSNTSHSPIVLTRSSVYASGYEAYKTLEDNDTTYWLGTGSGSDWVEYDFGSGNTHTMLGYEIRSDDYSPSTRAPKNWTVQGSNDDSSWTTIDTVTNQTGWAVDETRGFACDDVSTAYRYFKIVITANNGDATYTAINEVWFYQAGSATNRKTCGSYALKFGVTVGRAPKNWTLEGTNGGAWNVLHTATNQTSWSEHETRTFTVDVATTAYQYFRLNITANNGDVTYTSIDEWYLYEAVASARSRAVVIE